MLHRLVGPAQGQEHAAQVAVKQGRIRAPRQGALDVADTEGAGALLVAQEAHQVERVGVRRVAVQDAPVERLRARQVAGPLQLHGAPQQGLGGWGLGLAPVGHDGRRS